MPQGQGIADIAISTRVELRTYPDTSQKTLQDIWKENAKKLGIIVP
ncbi:hypothetical protein [Paenibacillus sp. FSL H7-0331]|nr:hypothetical protein [Paenibacillus sp. FSL H7-0331]